MTDIGMSSFPLRYLSTIPISLPAISVLEATLSTENTIRNNAETTLQQWEGQVGFLASLLRLALSNEEEISRVSNTVSISIDVLQRVALVYFKNTMRRCWRRVGQTMGGGSEGRTNGAVTANSPVNETVTSSAITVTSDERRWICDVLAWDIYGWVGGALGDGSGRPLEEAPGRPRLRDLASIDILADVVAHVVKEDTGDMTLTNYILSSIRMILDILSSIIHHPSSTHPSSTHPSSTYLASIIRQAAVLIVQNEVITTLASRRLPRGRGLFLELAPTLLQQCFEQRTLVFQSVLRLVGDARDCVEPQRTHHSSQHSNSNANDTYNSGGGSDGCSRDMSSMSAPISTLWSSLLRAATVVTQSITTLLTLTQKEDQALQPVIAALQAHNATSYHEFISRWRMFTPHGDQVTPLRHHITSLCNLTLTLARKLHKVSPSLSMHHVGHYLPDMVRSLVSDTRPTLLSGMDNDNIPLIISTLRYLIMILNTTDESHFIAALLPYDLQRRLVITTITQGMMMSQQEWKDWRNDPEDYFFTNECQSWKHDVRATAQSFYCTLTETLLTVVLEVMHEMFTTVVDWVVALLQPSLQGGEHCSVDRIWSIDAMLLGIGLSIPSLSDSINVSSLTTPLLTFLTTTTFHHPHRPILQRRIVWFLSCVSVYTPPLMQHHIVEVTVKVLERETEIVTILTAVRALEVLMDLDSMTPQSTSQSPSQSTSEEVITDPFLPHAAKSLIYLIRLLPKLSSEDAYECVLGLVSLFIQRMAVSRTLPGDSSVDSSVNSSVTSHIHLLASTIPEIWMTVGTSPTIQRALVNVVSSIIPLLPPHHRNDFIGQVVAPICHSSLMKGSEREVYLRSLATRMLDVVLSHSLAIPSPIIPFFPHVLLAALTESEGFICTMHVILSYVVMGGDGFLLMCSSSIIHHPLFITHHSSSTSFTNGSLLIYILSQMLNDLNDKAAICVSQLVDVLLRLSPTTSTTLLHSSTLLAQWWMDLFYGSTIRASASISVLSTLVIVSSMTALQSLPSSLLTSIIHHPSSVTQTSQNVTIDVVLQLINHWLTILAQGGTLAHRRHLSHGLISLLNLVVSFDHHSSSIIHHSSFTSSSTSSSTHPQLVISICRILNMICDATSLTRDYGGKVDVDEMAMEMVMAMHGESDDDWTASIIHHPSSVIHHSSSTTQVSQYIQRIRNQDPALVPYTHHHPSSIIHHPSSTSPYIDDSYDVLEVMIVESVITTIRRGWWMTDCDERWMTLSDSARTLVNLALDTCRRAG